VVRHAVKTDKIRSRLGWKCETDFERGLATTVDWYVKNRRWWEPIKSGEFLEYYRRMYSEIA
jgi:dTDP-glucose 4,6-dehydratase